LCSPRLILTHSAELGSNYIGSRNILRTDFFGLTQIIWRQGGAFSPAVPIGSEFLIETVDRLAKSLYSFILADLGQSTPSNILAHPSLLMEFVNLTENQIPSPYNGLSGSLGYPPMDSETAFFNQTQKFAGLSIPSIDPSTISAQYLCQVPVRKSIGSLIISILVADLVFLQALWKILNWVVTLGLERRHPEARYCIGCAKQLPHDGHELVNKTISRTLSRESCSRNVDALERHSTGLGIQVRSLEAQEEPARKRSLVKPTQEALP